MRSREKHAVRGVRTAYGRGYSTRSADVCGTGPGPEKGVPSPSETNRVRSCCETDKVAVRCRSALAKRVLLLTWAPQKSAPIHAAEVALRRDADAAAGVAPAA